MQSLFSRQTRPQVVECVATADNTRGPFYRANAPFRQNSLCSPSEPGAQLTLSGYVRGSPACVPLENAVLDVWQANAKGLYSNMLGLRSHDDPKAFHLRGRFRTDSGGRYQIETILPGHYSWPFRRARHIHVRLTCTGYSDLTTQLFFAGDRYLRSDHWIKPSLILQLTEEKEDDSNIRRRTTFDFVLIRSSHA